MGYEKPTTGGECAGNGGSGTPVWEYVLVFLLILLINNTDSAQTGYTSKFMDGLSNVPGATSDTNALLINYDVCGKNTCFECEATVTVKHIPYEPMSCDISNGNIKNGSCYLCNNTCLTADDISLLWKENPKIKKPKIICQNNAPKDIDCCLIAQMENFEKRNVEGRYNCYRKSVHEKYGKPAIRPLFQCRFGRKGDRCDELQTETVQNFVCKCSKLNYKFLGQVKLSECSKEPTSSYMSECYMPVAGKWHNCRCHDKNETGKMVSCDSPQFEAVKGSCSATFSSLPVELFLTLMTCYLTDLGSILEDLRY